MSVPKCEEFTGNLKNPVTNRKVKLNTDTYRVVKSLCDNAKQEKECSTLEMVHAIDKLRTGVSANMRRTAESRCDGAAESRCDKAPVAPILSLTAEDIVIMSHLCCTKQQSCEKTRLEMVTILSVVLTRCPTLFSTLEKKNCLSLSSREERFSLRRQNLHLDAILQKRSMGGSIRSARG